MDNLPLGAEHDSNAPYNESLEEEFKFSASIIIEKEFTISKFKEDVIDKKVLINIISEYCNELENDLGVIITDSTIYN